MLWRLVDELTRVSDPDTELELLLGSRAGGWCDAGKLMLAT